MASRRLEQLWEQVCKRWEREACGRVDSPVALYYPIQLPNSLAEREVETELPRPRSAAIPVALADLCEEDERPVWSEVTLAIADAIRNGEAVVHAPLPLAISALIPESPLITAWLDELARDFTGVKIELKDQDKQAKFKEQLQKHGQRLVEAGRRIVQMAAGGGTLHAAFDAYSAWIGLKYVGVDRKVTQWGATSLLVTGKGGRFDATTKGNHANFQIPNIWFRLTERVRKDQTDFRGLSYNKLRKTAANLVREYADGEVAAVFLCHGTPVRADALLDVYTNRPFKKVFDALDRVCATLAPLWAGMAEPFPEEPKRGGPNISPGKIRRIQMRKRQGCKTGFIAKQLEASQETVRRWAKRSAAYGETYHGTQLEW